MCIAVGIIMYTLVPRPQALAPKAWALASIFLATILGAAPRRARARAARWRRCCVCVPEA